jgi:hypothetical protein
MRTLAVGFAYLFCVSAAQAFQPLSCNGPGDHLWTVDGRTISTKLRAGEVAGRLTNEKPIVNGKQWRTAFISGAAMFTLTGQDYELAFDSGTVTRGRCRRARR